MTVAIVLCIVLLLAAVWLMRDEIRHLDRLDVAFVLMCAALGALIAGVAL